MNRLVSAQVNISVIFWNHVNVVEHKTVKLSKTFLDFEKAGVHHKTFVETTVVKLFHDKDAVMDFFEKS